MYDHTFLFPHADIPSPNRQTRKSYHAYMKRRQLLNDELHAMSVGKRPPVPLKHAWVYVTRVGTKALDADNFFSAAKPLLDAFVTNRILESDKWEAIGIPIPEQISTPHKAAHGWRVRVEQRESGFYFML